MKNHCSTCTEYSANCFGCYLSQPCDDCPAIASNSGTSKVTGLSGRFCPDHTDHSKYVRALND